MASTGQPSPVEVPAADTRERWVVRLAAAISQWERPQVSSWLLEPSVVADELLAWAQDDGRWDDRRPDKDWRSLLDDAIASWQRLGPELGAVASVDDALDELRVASDSSRLREAMHRSPILAAAQRLTVAFQAPNALQASARDMLAAAQASRYPESLGEKAAWQLALLASVGEKLGHDWAIVASRVKRVLGQAQGQTPAQTIAAVLEALPSAPSEGHSLVWLEIDHAYAEGMSPNPSVQLFDGDWLMAVLAHWEGPRDGVPDEIAADAEGMAHRWRRLDEAVQPKDELPVVLARIDLGIGPTAGARERARDTMELLIARASVRQGGTNWRVGHSCLHFVDGQLISESSSPLGDPDVYNRLTRGDILNDPSAKTIREETERLKDHLPVAPGPMHTVLQLSSWLRDARSTSAPARLVLASRIIETTANWAGLSPPELISDHLIVPRCVDRLADDLARAGKAAVYRLDGHDGTSSTPEQREEFLAVRHEIIIDRGRGVSDADPSATFARLNWLAERHGPETEIGDYLRELAGRLADGPALAAWLAAQRDQFLVANRRGVRSRNAIVHGGPLQSEVVRSVVGLQDALAALALTWVIDALVSDRPVGDVFAERAALHSDALARLEAGDSKPADELPELLAG